MPFCFVLRIPVPRCVDEIYLRKAIDIVWKSSCKHQPGRLQRRPTHRDLTVTNQKAEAAAVRWPAAPIRSDTSLVVERYVYRAQAEFLERLIRYSSTCKQLGGQLKVVKSADREVRRLEKVYQIQLDRLEPVAA